MLHRVFVYGTLKQGFSNHHVNTGTREPGDYETLHPYPLWIAGPRCLPWLVDQCGQGHRVRGQVYRVDAPGLARLDALERLDEPGWYTRQLILVRRRDEAGAAPQPVHVYFGSATRWTAAELHLGPVAEFTADMAAPPG